MVLVQLVNWPMEPLLKQQVTIVKHQDFQLLIHLFSLPHPFFLPHFSLQFLEVHLEFNL